MPIRWMLYLIGFFLFSPIFAVGAWIYLIKDEEARRYKRFWALAVVSTVFASVFMVSMISGNMA